jgi:hypothetical protein
MSTNFYIDNSSNNVENLILTGKISSIWTKNIQGIVHIGKRSSGWTFLFRSYEGIIETYDEWVEYISSIGWVIDEYNNIFSSEEFIKIVNDTLKPHYNSYINEYRDPIDSYEFLKKERCTTVYKDEKGYCFDRTEFS